MELTNCVGKNCANERNDVMRVQDLLIVGGFYNGKADGLCGPRTLDAIIQFQKTVLTNPDGRVDPGGATWRRLEACRSPQGGEEKSETSLFITEADYEEAAQTLGCEIAAIKAVAEVESAGAGFLRDGRPRILFEGHWFHRNTDGVYSESHPTLSHPKQTNEFYSRGTPEQQGAGELKRLYQARELNSRAALLSCSVGKFQVMGFNYKLCGYESVEEFWDALASHEREQLRAFCAFVKAKRLVKHLVHHDWAGFAAGYNGRGYKKFKYDSKIESAYAKFAEISKRRIASA